MHELVPELRQVDVRLARVGAPEGELERAVVGLGHVVVANALTGELGPVHHLEHPPHLLSGDDGREPLAGEHSERLGRARFAVGRHEVERPFPGDAHRQQAAAPRLRRVHDQRRPGRGVHLGGELPHRLPREDVADLARLVIADHHLVDDLVVAARARGVVRAVLHELLPCHPEERVGIPVRRHEQGRQRLRAPLERALRERARLVHVDAVRRHSHEHVGARPRSQLAPHRRQSVSGLLGEVLGERGDDEPVLVLDLIRLRDDAAEPRLRHLVVGAVHQQHRPAGKPGRTELELVAPRPRDQLLGVVGKVATVRVRPVQVLRAYR